MVVVDVARPEAPPVDTLTVVGDDDVLVARLAAGDDEAVGDLFDRYGPFVLGVARRVTGNTDLAEDVVQEVFTALWSAPDKFEAARGSLRTYLGMLAHRRAVDAVRRNARRRAREDRSALGDVARLASSGTDATDAATLTQVVRAAIKKLPVDQRVAVELVFWNGLTCREVACVLAIPEGTAKSRLRLAQTKLSEWLKPLIGEPA